MGSAAGVKKGAASRIGISVAEYDLRVAAGQKWCIGCRRWHPKRAFGPDRSRNDGLAARCVAARITSIDSPGRTERRAAQRRGQSWCRGCHAWLPVGDVSSGACREHANADARNYYAGRSETIAQRKAARKRGLDPVPDWWRLDVVDEFQGLCAYGCGRPADTLDHIWPYARGGKSQPGNLAPSCKPCNSSKRDRDPALWVERGCAAFPAQWLHLMELAFAVGCDYWMEPS